MKPVISRPNVLFFLHYGREDHPVDRSVFYDLSVESGLLKSGLSSPHLMRCSFVDYFYPESIAETSYEDHSGLENWSPVRLKHLSFSWECSVLTSVMD